MTSSHAETGAVADDGIRNLLRSRTCTEPTDEDVRESKQNLLGFFGVIREWILEDRAKTGQQPARDERCEKR